MIVVSVLVGNGGDGVTCESGGSDASDGSDIS